MLCFHRSGNHIVAGKSRDKAKEYDARILSAEKSATWPGSRVYEPDDPVFFDNMSLWIRENVSDPWKFGIVDRVEGAQCKVIYRVYDSNDAYWYHQKDVFLYKSAEEDDIVQTIKPGDS